MKVRTPSFTTRDGDRFFIPGYFVTESEDSISASDVIFQSMMLSSVLGSSCSVDKEWIEFDDEYFPHVNVEMNASCFLHGYTNVYAFAGPIFNQVKSEGSENVV